MDWPRGNDSIPARTCSATREDVYKPRHTTAVTKIPQGGGICLIMAPSDAGRISGTTKYHKNISTSSGILRNSSTYAAPRKRAHCMRVVRPIPNSKPIPNARIHDRVAEPMVQAKKRKSDVGENMCR